MGMFDFIEGIPVIGDIAGYGFDMLGMGGPDIGDITDAINQGRDKGIYELSQGYDKGQNVMGEGFARGEDTLSQAYGQAFGARQPYVGYGQSMIPVQEARMQSGYYDPGQRQAYQFSQPQYTGMSLNDFEQDPGYQFRKQEMINSLGAKAAAGGTPGGRFGSAASTELAGKVGQMASDEYANAYNRAMGLQDRNAQANMWRQGQEYGQVGDLYGAQRQRLLDQYGLASNTIGTGYGMAGDIANLYSDYGKTMGGYQSGAGQMLGNSFFNEGQGISDLYTDAMSAQAGAMGADTTANAQQRGQLLGLGAKVLPALLGGG